MNFYEQLASVKERHEGWWNHKNTTPLYGFTIEKNPTIPKPLTQANCHDFSKSPAELAADIETYLKGFDYYGDAFPFYNMDAFGPGIIVAMLGARLDNSSGRVWFHPTEIRELKDINFEFDPNNIWYKRILDISLACTQRFKGSIALSMPDLGGILDILSTFRPSELLLYDLYDEPDEVLRLVKELEVVWHHIHKELCLAMECDKYGYTDWSGIWSRESSYIIQCDFAYMISPDMFHTFAYDTLKNDCEKLNRTIYHLDGPGQLCHVESLLAIDRLNCVQWIPGDGNPGIESYPQLLRKLQMQAS